MSTFEQAERREAHRQAQSVLRAGVPADANGDRDCRFCKHYGHSGDYMDHGYCAHPHAQKLSAHKVSPSYMHSLALCTNRAAHLFERDGDLAESQEGAGVISKTSPRQSNPQEAVNVGFAEIAIDELGFSDDDTDFYGLNERGIENGGNRMVELVEKQYISREDHDRRVTELLEANNRMLERARGLRVSLGRLYRVFLERHGCFPLDRTNEEQRRRNEAMLEAKNLLGESVP